MATKYFTSKVTTPQECSQKVSAAGLPLVSCLAHTRLPVRNGLVNEVEFLGLITQNR